MNRLRVAIYARVSSDKQREKQTIESQLAVLAPWVKAQGWDLGEPPRIYADDGLTARAGHLDDREEFARLQRDAEAGQFDVIAVFEIDRLTRSEDQIERAQVLGPFQRLGIQIATPSTGLLDMRTLMGDLWINLKAIFAADFSRVLSKRVQAGQERVAREGGKSKGCTPFGLTYDRVTKAWGVDPVRGPLVVELFERVAGKRGEPESVAAVARSFGDRGAPAPRGSWNASTAQKIAVSTHVIGEWLADRRKRVWVPVPRLVSDAVYYAVQERLQARKLRGLSHTRHTYLLQSLKGEAPLAVCGLCGAPVFIVTATGGKHARAAKYQCKSSLRGRPDRPAERCTARAVRVDDLDARVWSTIVAEVNSPGLADRMQCLAEELRAEQHDWSKDLAQYRAKLAKLDKAEGVLLGMFQDGDIDEAAMRARLADNKRTRALLRSNIETAEAAIRRAAEAAPAEDPELWLGHLRQLASAASKATTADRREIVRGLISPGAMLSATGQLTLVCRFDAPAPASDRTPVRLSACRTPDGTSVQIRLVA